MRVDARIAGRLPDFRPGRAGADTEEVVEPAAGLGQMGVAEMVGESARDEEIAERAVVVGAMVGDLGVAQLAPAVGVGGADVLVQRLGALVVAAARGAVAETAVAALEVKAAEVVVERVGRLECEQA